MHLSLHNRLEIKKTSACIPPTEDTIFVTIGGPIVLEKNTSKVGGMCA